MCDFRYAHWCGSGFNLHVASQNNSRNFTAEAGIQGKEAADRPTCHSSGGVASSGMHFGGDIFWRKISPYATTLIAFQTVRVRLSKRFSYIYEL